MTIKHIFVIGAGTMGNGIAQVAATSGYQVTCMDVQPAALEKAKATIAKSTAKLLEKGTLITGTKNFGRCNSIRDKYGHDERRGLGHRSRNRKSRIEIQDIQRHGCQRARRRDLGNQHLIHFDYKNRRRHQTPR